MGKLKVLAVDDDEAFRKILQSVLEGEGYDVRTAENGKVAQGLFAHQDFGLVISDVRMPEVDGLALLKSIRRTHHHLPVILITGLAVATTAEFPPQPGALVFLAKPFRRDGLLRAIAAVLASVPGGAGESDAEERRLLSAIVGALEREIGA